MLLLRNSLLHHICFVLVRVEIWIYLINCLICELCVEIWLFILDAWRFLPCQRYSSCNIVALWNWCLSLDFLYLMDLHPFTITIDVEIRSSSWSHIEMTVILYSSGCVTLLITVFYLLNYSAPVIVYLLLLRRYNSIWIYFFFGISLR